MGYCAMCGSPIPDGQSVCSMCYGDPFYGKDGYYLEWLEEQERQELEEQERVHQQMEDRMAELEEEQERLAEKLKARS